MFRQQGVKIVIEMRLLIAAQTVLSLVTFAANAQTVVDQCHQVVIAERALGGLRWIRIRPYRQPAPRPDCRARLLGTCPWKARQSAEGVGIGADPRGKGTKGKMVTSQTGSSGVFRFENLPQGVYYFVAAAQGFQSISGCVVIRRKAGKRPPVLLRLPLGV